MKERSKININLNEWHYKCGDGCCDMYGTEISFNNEECENEYAGDDVEKSLEFILTKLGIDFEITHTQNDEK